MRQPSPRRVGLCTASQPGEPIGTVIAAQSRGDDAVRVFRTLARGIGLVSIAALAVGALAVGGAALWADGRLDDGRRVPATITLREGVRVDVEVSEDGRLRRLWMWDDGRPRGVGDRVEIDLATSPDRLARLAGDGRLAAWGGGLGAGGTGLLLGLIGFGWRRRRQRRRAAADDDARPAVDRAGTATDSDATTVGTAPAAGPGSRTGGLRSGALLLVLALPLSGCAVLDTTVADRGGYADARARTMVAFPGIAGGPPTVLRTPAGVRVVDYPSPREALLAASEELPGSPREAAFAYLAQTVLDPATWCGSVRNPLAAAVTPALVPLTDQLASEGRYGASFPGCFGGWATLAVEDLWVGDSQVAYRFTPDGLAETAWFTFVHAIWDTPDGPAPMTQLVSGSFQTIRDAPFTIIAISVDPPQWSWGFGPAGVPDPTVFAPVNGSVIDGPTEAQLARPEGVVAVTEALDLSLQAGSFASTRTERVGPADLDEQATNVLEGTGAVYPGLREAEFVLNAATGPAGLRVLDGTQVATEGPPQQWSVLNTAQSTQVGGQVFSGNPIAVLDWLSSLRAAWPIGCDDLLRGDECYGVEVPIDRLYEVAAPDFVTPGGSPAAANPRSWSRWRPGTACSPGCAWTS